jgi:hypothetical protein|tara:strand:+ start:220 stop:1113 length:894 start_codon:yes stop_codon:yes gene_type:complete
MVQSFAELKRSSAQSSLDALLKETNKLTSNESRGNDDRFWKPTVDASGNGYAVIRFLPATKGDEVEQPWVKMWNHGFQGPGGWYIENSLTTLGKDDPVSKHNNMLWNRGDDAGKEEARRMKRRLLYISNVYIVNDSSHPENNGQVKLFRYGKKIFDKLLESMNPEFPDSTPVNPFHFWEGANFKMKIRNYQGYRNYDKSEFEKPSKIDEDDSKVENIWNSQYKLSEFIDPSNFKTYQELEAKLNKVLMTSTSDVTAEDVELAPEPAPVVKPPKESIAAAKVEESDANMDYFQDMLKD